jgi:BioD-like phosphotransacetylase family protein
MTVRRVKPLGLMLDEGAILRMVRGTGGVITAGHTPFVAVINTNIELIAMSQTSSPHVFFLAPLARDIGFTSIALGLVQALQRDRIRVGFAEPIARPEDHSGNTHLATHFARTLLHVRAPEPIPFLDAEERVRTGQLDALLEEVVSLVDQAGAGTDVVVVEGLVPIADLQIAAQLNTTMARSLSAVLVPVISGAYLEAQGATHSLDLALHQFGEGSDHPPTAAGVLINMLAPTQAGTHQTEQRVGREAGVAVPAAVPFEPRFTAPRLRDVVEPLGLDVAYEGDLASGRVQEIVVSGRGVEGVIDRFRPGAIIVVETTTCARRSVWGGSISQAMRRGCPSPLERCRCRAACSRAPQSAAAAARLADRGRCRLLHRRIYPHLVPRRAQLVPQH